jgi:hypothetical protein
VKNRLEIAVPKGNPSKITWLADFGALCAQQVPCGAAAKKVFEAAKITGKPDSLEQDVKAALTKVSLGEVDAALVYKTDVQAAAGKVDGIELPEAHKAINEYPIATLTKAPNASGAKAFSRDPRRVRRRAAVAGDRQPSSLRKEPTAVPGRRRRTDHCIAGGWSGARRLSTGCAVALGTPGKWLPQASSSTRTPSESAWTVRRCSWPT